MRVEAPAADEVGQQERGVALGVGVAGLGEAIQLSGGIVIELD